MMLSSLCLDEFKKFCPTTLERSFPLGKDGFKVIFDVEDVLSDPAWLRFLREKRGLEKVRSVYFHRLHPVWITLK